MAWRFENWFENWNFKLFYVKYNGISTKRTPLAQKKMSALYRCPLYRDFSNIVWPQSKAIRSPSYCPSYGGVHFIVCPLYRDSTVRPISKHWQNERHTSFRTSI